MPNSSLYTAYCTEYPVFMVTGYFKKPHSKTKTCFDQVLCVRMHFSVETNPMQYQVRILTGLTYSIVVCTSLDFIVCLIALLEIFLGCLESKPFDLMPSWALKFLAFSFSLCHLHLPRFLSLQVQLLAKQRPLMCFVSPQSNFNFHNRSPFFRSIRIHIRI